ncbi:MAG: POT family MFS transporter [Verrucomicrobiota bacterium]
MTKSSPYRTAPVPSKVMPPGIPYIVGNEAAERFSFYGMRTILTIFMVQYLWLMGSSPDSQMSDEAAQERFHNFVSAAYFFPIFGAIIADAFLGKYRTIIALSIVYCIGHGLLALMGSVWNAQSLLFWGLALIAIGSGGIKPCVSAHVGDQFGKTNAHLLTRVFNYFYFSINLGAFISTLLTPWVLKWYGPHWAFGIPGVLMAIATLVFWMGRHKFIHIPARGLPFLKEVFSKRGLFAILKLAIIYVFVAVFWALFDQTGSSWVLQAQDMNLQWLGITWLPSQIQAINPIMILIYIPLFTFVFYPALNKIFPLTPLRKISIGLFVMVIGFGLVALAQTWIDAGQRPSIGWQVLAYAILTASEVMVSIVCLEFSYTQAPRTMKSVVMAVFLMSVSLGNFFTAGVNHFIQVPNTVAAIDATPAAPVEGPLIFNHPGFDNKTNTDDDIQTEYLDGKRTTITSPAQAALEQAAAKIDTFIQNNNWTLPSSDEASQLIAGISDPWDNQIQYTLVNSRQSRLTSLGPDQKPLTKWDMGIVINLDLPAPTSERRGPVSRFFDKLTPTEPWLDLQRKRHGLNIKSEEAGSEPSLSRSTFIGGQSKLEGAAYFWFFTKVMLGTAILFVIVAYFYRPKTYLHEEAETLDEDFEATGKP